MNDSSNHGDHSTASANNETLLLGIDGGGSKTEAWLGCLRDGELVTLGVGQGGPSNPQSVGLNLALQNLTNTMQLAFANASISPTQVATACLCLAGTGRQQERDAVLSWARQSQLADRSILVSEAEAVLACAALKSGLPKPPERQRAEVALICGTGSLAWGRNSRDSESIRCGGWGYLLGDEGSGYWLGRHILQLACKAADGRAAANDVLQAVLAKIQVNTFQELVGWCYEQSDGRERIASFAPLAFGETPSDNLRDVVNRGAHELAEMVSTVVSRLQSREYDLALAGSVVIHQAEYRNLIEKRLSQLGFQPSSIQRVEQPVKGALQLALEEYRSIHR